MALNSLYQAFIDASKEAGYPETDDYNEVTPTRSVFGAMHMTVDKGVRTSTSNAYLRRASKRSNLTLKKALWHAKSPHDGKSGRC